jgi:hypothetical protein
MTGAAMRLNSTILAASLATLTLAISPVRGETIARDQLVDDVRQLAGTIEDVHPDPYINGGGKIAFQRRLHKVLAAIPEEGMSAEEFYRLLRPFVASVGDAHTWLRDPYQSDPYAPGGIPLYFDIVEGGLYVFAVLGEEFRRLIGARLVSVEGVTLAELVRRQGERMGSENDYLLLRNLDRQGVLWKRCFLEHLLPEWEDKDRITVKLKFPDGRTEEHTLEVPAKIDYSAFIYTRPGLQLPSLMMSLQKCDFDYDFIDSTKKTCLLVVNDMSGYREAFEMWADLGVTSHDDHAREVYRKYNGAEPPLDLAEVIKGIPSATELFKKMAVDMKESATENLLIDLRHNSGGNSMMYNYLIYVLYGRDKLLSLKGRGLEIRKLSQTYFDSYTEESIEEISHERPLPLEVGDYDFFYDYPHFGRPDSAAILETFEKYSAMSPSFHSEWLSGEFDGYYLPERVFVLSSGGTFSSGYTMMHYLSQAGAKVVGTPSSQGGNCFGDIIGFKLDNSGLSFNVSHKYFELYPNDPDRGRLLLPDYLLTYDKLAGYGFDPEATILYALDLINDLSSIAE